MLNYSLLTEEAAGVLNSFKPAGGTAQVHRSHISQKTRDMGHPQF
jgi:hypothetical protein